MTGEEVRVADAAGAGTCGGTGRDTTARAWAGHGGTGGVARGGAGRRRARGGEREVGRRLGLARVVRMGNWGLEQVRARKKTAKSHSGKYPWRTAHGVGD